MKEQQLISEYHSQRRRAEVYQNSEQYVVHGYQLDILMVRDYFTTESQAQSWAKDWCKI